MNSINFDTYRRPNDDEYESFRKLVPKNNSEFLFYLGNLDQLPLCHGFNEQDFLDKCILYGVDLNKFERSKKKQSNTYDIVFPEVIKIMKQKEKVKPRVLIRMIKQELSELKGSQISRVIKRMISYGILEYLVRKSYKHIIKGHYWNSHVR